MRRLLTVLLVGTLLVGWPAVAQGKKKPVGPVIVWDDPAGDADLELGTGSSIPAGLDLTAATITRDGSNLEFTVMHADMPPVGTLPEAARFLWGFTVDGRKYFRFTVKSVDIGKPDLSQGQTTERVGRVDAEGHFRLEGQCNVDGSGSQVNCPPLEYLSGSFDPASKSFTIVVPLASIEAKGGSMISSSDHGYPGICSLCWISHAAERSPGLSVIDIASEMTPYKVPR